jgi:hypothetical protein
MPTPFGLLNISIVTSEGETFTSQLGGETKPSAAVVSLQETFTLSAIVTHSKRGELRVKVTASPPAGSGYRVQEPSTHDVTLAPGKSEAPVSWNVVAPSAADTSAQKITVSVYADDADAGDRRIEQTIDVIAGPSQLAIIGPPFSIEAGEPSPPITVQIQNAIGQPQKPLQDITVTLRSSSSGTYGYFSDSACTLKPVPSGGLLIAAKSGEAIIYYKDAAAGAPRLSASCVGLQPFITQTGDVTITQAKTTTKLSISPTTSSPFEDPVTLTAKVITNPPASGVPTGSVQFRYISGTAASVPIGAPIQLSAGVAIVHTDQISIKLPQGPLTIKAEYTPTDSSFARSDEKLPFCVSPPQVTITGKILTAAGQQPIPGVPVFLEDSQGKPITSSLTDNAGTGTYSFKVNLGAQLYVLFPPFCTGPNGQRLYLKPPGSIYVEQTNATPLPPTYYELRTCQVSGTVVQKLGTRLQPLSRIQVSLVDPSQAATVYETRTDAQGNFCFNPETGATNFVLQLLPTVTVGKDTLVLSPNALGVSETQTKISLRPDFPSTLKPFIYTPQLSTVIGQVTDGENGLVGIPVELSIQGGLQTTTTDATGIYTFSNLPPGTAELRFQTPSTDASGTEWELQPGQQGTQSLSIRAGQVVHAATVAYQPEQHSVEQLVLVDGRPADNVLVDVRPQGAHYASQSQRTGKDGRVIFVLPKGGQYEVRVYPDPSASGGPQVNVVEVHSHAMSPTVNLPTSGGGARGAAQNGDRAAIDLQAYPVLTEEMPAGIMPATTRPGPAGAVGGTSALGQAADKAIREVLSWRTKSDDAKGFLTALGQAFELTEVEGHTEWTWTPRSYTVQTDLGAVTGAQASIYTRAKVALDQSLPLLDGIYPLVPNVEAEDLATVQSVVRTQFTALVNEFGTVGGPRVSRVDELFELLLGHEDPDQPPTKPEEIVKGSLGLVRQRFGLQRGYVTTVDDEQNLTNYLILVDYVIGLNHSWIHDKNYFIRNGIKPGFAPFFGTQLVLLSRALDVVAEGVHDAYFAMDSVFMGDAERQVAQLNFAGLIVKVPNPKTGGVELHTFGPNTSGLYVAELLDWVDRAVSDELPRLLQDAGKDGLESLQRVTNRLRKFVHGAIVPPQSAPGLPPGYHTPRVKRAMQLLADGLDETYKLAVQLRPPDLPVEVSPDDLRRLIRDEISRASAKA